jgi:peptidoglycan L-alanyl-D-glutamate endopeptidase CwlK
MYAFGEKSQSKLDTCHEDIQVIMNEVIKVYDVSVIEGHRSQETQMKYFQEGKSTLDGVNKKSKHQSYPSKAIDLMPYKKGTNAFSGNELDTRRFYFMMGIVKATAERLLAEGKISHKVRFGIDWDGDDVFRDQNFHDAPHFEIIGL